MAEGVAAGEHEGEFVGVYRVHLAVVNDDADIAGVATRERALFHAAHDTLEDGGHEACVDGTAYHGVDEDELAAPFQGNFFLALDGDADFLVAELVDYGVGHAVAVGFDNEVDFAELAGAAALLLVAIVGTCGLGEGFAVGDALGIELYGNLVEVLQAPLERAEVELALSLHENLAQFLALLHLPSGVFLAHTAEGSHHLFGVGFIDGTDGAGNLGVGVFDEVEAVVAVLGVEGVARAHILELHGTTDVAGGELFHFLTVGTGADEELGHAFLRAAVSVVEVVAFAYRTAHHLEVLHFADVRFHAGLEEVDGSGGFGVEGHLFAAGIVDGRHFVYEGNHVAEELHETAHAHVLGSTHAEYGEDAAGHHALADTFAHFVFGELFRFEELFHETFVVFGCGFNECAVHGFSLFLLSLGNILHHGFAAFGTPGEFLHEDDVDELVEVGSGGYGVLHGHYLVAVNGLEVFEHEVIVGILTVKLVHEENHGLAELLGVAEMVLRTNFGAEVTVDEEQCRVSHVEGGEGCAYEVVGTRTVDDVQLLAGPLGMENGGEHGVAVVLLHGEIVGNSVLGSDAAAALDLAAVEEESFGEGGFSRTIVTQEGDVLDFVRIVNFHGG